MAVPRRQPRRASRLTPGLDGERRGTARPASSTNSAAQPCDQKKRATTVARKPSQNTTIAGTPTAACVPATSDGLGDHVVRRPASDIAGERSDRSRPSPNRWSAEIASGSTPRRRRCRGPSHPAIDGAARASRHRHQRVVGRRRPARLERALHQQRAGLRGRPSGRRGRPARRRAGTAARSSRNHASAAACRSRCGSGSRTAARCGRGTTPRSRTG